MSDRGGIPIPLSPAELEAMTVRPSADTPKRLEAHGDCVVFRAVAAGKTRGGLHVPQKGRESETRQHAIVVSVGPGQLREDGTRAPMSVQPGDQIVLWPSAPTPGCIDAALGNTGEALYICHDEDIAGVVAPAEDASGG